MQDFKILDAFQTAMIECSKRQGISYDDLMSSDEELITHNWKADYSYDWSEQIDDANHLVNYINKFKDMMNLQPNAIYDQALKLARVRSYIMGFNAHFDNLMEDIYKLLTQYYHASLCPLSEPVVFLEVLAEKDPTGFDGAIFDTLRLQMIEAVTRLQGSNGLDQMLSKGWDYKADCYRWMLDYNTSWQSIYQYYYAGLEQRIHEFIDLMTHDKNDAQLEIQALSNLHYYLTRLHHFLYCDLLSDVEYLDDIYDASGLCVET